MALALALVVLGVLARIDIEAPRLGKTVLDRAGAATGLSLAAARSSLRPFEGIGFEDVTIESAFPGGALRVQAPRLLFEHRPSSLLGGRWMLSRVTISRPRVGIELGAAPMAERAAPLRPGPSAPSADEGERATVDPSDPPRGAWNVMLVPEEVEIEGARVRVLDGDDGRERLALEGLTIILGGLSLEPGALTLLHAVEGTGEIAAEELDVETLRLREMSARIATGGGRFRLEALRFTSGRGQLEGELTTDFNSIPFRYQASLRGRGFRLEGIGRGDVLLDVEGFGTRPENVKGTGALTLVPGRLPRDSFLAELDPALAGTHHAAARFDFEIGKGRIAIRDSQLDAAPFVVRLSGSLGLDGVLDLSLTLRRDGVERNYRLRGTVEEPTLVLVNAAEPKDPI